MEKRATRSLQSTSGHSKRGRTASPGPKSRGGGKSRKSYGSKKSNQSAAKYDKLVDADEVEMADLGAVGGDYDLGPVQTGAINNNSEMRPHEIYENTTYIPNK